MHWQAAHRMKFRADELRTNPLESDHVMTGRIGCCLDYFN